MDLKRIASRADIPLAGVVSRDQKYPNCLNQLLVINLDSLAGPGTHWCGLIEFSNHFEYFDPFGVVPPTEVVDYCALARINGSTKHVLYQDEQMQDLDSQKCGWYVLLWAWLRLVKKQSTRVVFKKYINEGSVSEFKQEFGH